MAQALENGTPIMDVDCPICEGPVTLITGKTPGALIKGKCANLIHGGKTCGSWFTAGANASYALKQQFIKDMTESPANDQIEASSEIAEYEAANDNEAGDTDANTDASEGSNQEESTTSAENAEKGTASDQGGTNTNTDTRNGTSDATDATDAAAANTSPNPSSAGADTGTGTAGNDDSRVRNDDGDDFDSVLFPS